MLKVLTILALLAGLLYVSPFRWYVFPAPEVEIGEYR